MQRGVVVGKRRDREAGPAQQVADHGTVPAAAHHDKGGVISGHPVSLPRFP